MAFTVRDFHDLVRLLHEHPEWREELRALLLSPEILRLPKLLEGLSAKVEQLAEAQVRTERALAELSARMTTLVEAQHRTEADVGELKGMSLEQRYRERAPALFAKVLRRARLLPDAELLELLDSPQARESLSAEERDELLLADLVVWGRRRADDAEVYLVGEVSWVVDCADVERARHRADLLARLGFTAIPVVAGRTITPEADHLARAKKVLRILDGIYHPD